jgi:hypothetical protein
MNGSTTATESWQFILKLLGVAELSIIYWLQRVTLFWDIGVNPIEWIRCIRFNSILITPREVDIHDDIIINIL